ncbi:hypothetical protein, partial [Salinicola socius]|uniref:hypothetical protein n=1 Tax=Salinicola socius TaxID=404433 RepID=UPI001ABF8C21
WGCNGDYAFDHGMGSAGKSHSPARPAFPCCSPRCPIYRFEGVICRFEAPVYQFKMMASAMRGNRAAWHGFAFQSVPAVVGERIVPA